MSHTLHLTRTTCSTFPQRHGTAEHAMAEYTGRLKAIGTQYNSPWPGAIEFTDRDGAKVQITWEDEA